MLLHDYYDNDNTKNSTRLDRRGPISLQTCMEMMKHTEISEDM